MFGDHEPFLSSFDKVHPDDIMLSRLFSRSCMEVRPFVFFIPFICISQLPITHVMPLGVPQVPCAKLFSKISAGSSWFLHAATWVDQFSFLIFQFVLRKLQRPYHVGGMSCNSAGYHFPLNLQKLNQWHLIPQATDRVNSVQYGQTQIMRVWADGTYSGRIELWNDTSICQLWPILSELYAKTHWLKKMTENLGTKSTANFAHHLLFFPKNIFPYPRRLASHNSMVKKDDKMGNKSRYRKGKERKDRDQERRIEIDSQKSPNFALCTSAKNKSEA